MADTLADRLAAVHPQMLRVEPDGDRKQLADWRPRIGRLVARALQLMGITKQDAAYRLHYEDAGTISRWCSGTERPAFDKLAQLPGFDVAYMQATAEQDPSCDVTTAITIRRIA